MDCIQLVGAQGRSEGICNPDVELVLVERRWESLATRHNFRGASGGMPWPDLTVVPEGAVSRVVWQGGPGAGKQPIRFIGAGKVYVDSRQIMNELGRFVTQVVDRLDESGVPSPLAKEWHALRELDDEEAAFASAAACLGLDPFDMTDRTTNELVALAELLDQPLLDEFWTVPTLRSFQLRRRGWLKRGAAPAPSRYRQKVSLDSGFLGRLAGSTGGRSSVATP